MIDLMSFLFLTISYALILFWSTQVALPTAIRVWTRAGVSLLLLENIVRIGVGIAMAYSGSNAEREAIDAVRGFASALGAAGALVCALVLLRVTVAIKRNRVLS